MKVERLIMIVLIAAAMVCASCNSHPQAMDVPSLGPLRADSLTATSVVLKASLDNAQAVRECGIQIGDERYPAAVNANGLRCRIEGLAPSCEYSAIAFITNGKNTRTGEAISFRTRDQFPDAVFRTWALANYDTNGDGLISDSETATLERLEVPSEIGYGVQSTEGIEAFRGVRYIWFSGSWEGKTAFKSLDLSSFGNLAGVYAPFGVMETIQLPDGVTKMDHISLDYQNLTTIDFKQIREVSLMQIAHNKISSLDLSGFRKIGEFHCDDNELAELDLSSLEEIGSLICYQNPKLKRIIIKKDLEIKQLEKDEHTLVEYR